LFTYACECGGDAWFCGVYDDHLVVIGTDPEPGTGTGIHDDDDELFF
jgi:hypothetical protein